MNPIWGKAVFRACPIQELSGDHRTLKCSPSPAPLQDHLNGDPTGGLESTHLLALIGLFV